MAVFVSLCIILTVKACSSATNVAFFLDSSGSVLATGWEQALKFTQDFAQGTENSAVAAWSFSRSVTPIVDFTTDRDSIVEAVAASPWAKLDTNILDSMRTFEELPDRSGPMIMVLVTDGQHTARAEGIPDALTVNTGSEIFWQRQDFQDKANELIAGVAEKIRDNGRTIIVILVGEARAFRAQAEGWAGKKELVLEVAGYDQLAQKTQDVVNLSCIAIPVSILVVLGAIAATLCCCLSSAAVAKKKFSEEEEGTLQQTFAGGPGRNPPQAPNSRRRALE